MVAQSTWGVTAPMSVRTLSFPGIGFLYLGLSSEDHLEVCYLSVWGTVETPIPGITQGVRFLQFPLPAG